MSDDSQDSVSSCFSRWLNQVNSVKERQYRGSYVFFSKVIYDWSAFFLATPVRLHYDEVLGVFVVRRCNIAQRVGCVLAQILYSLSVAFSLFKTGSILLQHTGNITAYFDILNKIAVNIGIYIHVYIHWFRLDLVEAFIDAIQISPIIQYCRTPLWKPISGSCLICALIMYLTVTWLILCFGIDVSSWEGFQVSVQMSARELFWWDRNKAIEPSLPLCMIAFISLLFDSYFIHISLNAFTALQLYCIYFIINDFFNAMLERKIEASEALTLVQEYVTLMNKANRYLGLYVLQFTVMTMTYHSIHLFDMLNSPTLLWKISTYAYVGYVLNFYFLLAFIYIETKRIKKWLWIDRNYFKIPYPELLSILYDLASDNYKFGIRIGKFFSTTAAFSGAILAKMISYSMLIKLSER